VTWHLFHVAASTVVGLYGFAEEGESLMETYRRLARRRSDAPEEGLT
jgi:hypothetical protein